MRLIKQSVIEYFVVKSFGKQIHRNSNLDFLLFESPHYCSLISKFGFLLFESPHFCSLISKFGFLLFESPHYCSLIVKYDDSLDLRCTENFPHQNLIKFEFSQKMFFCFVVKFSRKYQFELFVCPPSLAGVLDGDVEGYEGGIHHPVAAPLPVPHLTHARCNSRLHRQEDQDAWIVLYHWGIYGISVLSGTQQYCK